MVALLDVNMLVAMSWPTHVQHRLARGWFSVNSAQGWGTCPFTQCGFVRLSSNPVILEEPVTPKEALAALSEVVARPEHIFWPDDFGLLDPKVPTKHLSGHKQVTDVYLLGLAIRQNARLVTMDKNVPDLLPLNSKLRKHVFVVKEG